MSDRTLATDRQAPDDSIQRLADLHIAIQDAQSNQAVTHLTVRGWRVAAIVPAIGSDQSHPGYRTVGWLESTAQAQARQPGNLSAPGSTDWSEDLAGLRQRLTQILAVLDGPDPIVTRVTGARTLLRQLRDSTAPGAPHLAAQEQILRTFAAPAPSQPPADVSAAVEGYTPDESPVTNQLDIGSSWSGVSWEEAVGAALDAASNGKRTALTGNDATVFAGIVPAADLKRLEAMDAPASTPVSRVTDPPSPYTVGAVTEEGDAISRIASMLATLWRLTDATPLWRDQGAIEDWLRHGTRPSY